MGRYADAWAAEQQGQKRPDYASAWLAESDPSRQTFRESLRKAWQSPPVGAAKSALGRVMDVLQRSNYAMNAARAEFAPEVREARGIPSDGRSLTIPEQLRSELADPTGIKQSIAALTAPYAASRYGKALARGFSGKEKAGYGDVIDLLYGQPSGPVEEKVRAGLGLVGDVAGDPMSYPSFGALTPAGKVARATGTAAPTLAGRVAAGEQGLMSLLGYDIGVGPKAAKLVEPFSKARAAFGGTKLGKGLRAGFVPGSWHTGLQARLGTQAGRELGDVAAGSKFVREMDTAVKDIAKATGRSVDEVRASFIDAIETSAQPSAGKTIEELMEDGFPVGSGEALGAATKWREWFAEDLIKSKGAELKIGDLGKSYVPMYFTDAWRRAMGQLQNQHPALDISAWFGNMEHRVLTAGLTHKQVNEILETRGLRGLLSAVGDETAGALPEGVNIVVKGAVEMDPAKIAQRYIRGAARARSSAQLLDDVRTMPGVLKLGPNGELAEGARQIMGVPGLEKYAAHPDLAAEIEKQMVKLVGPTDKTRGAVRVVFEDYFDEAQNWWKAWTLAVFPSYHIRNVVGNMWNTFLSGTTDPKAFHDAARLQMAVWEPSSKFGKAFQRGAFKALGEVDLNEVARKYGYQGADDLMETARANGILGHGFLAREVPEQVGVAGRVGRVAGRQSEAIKGGRTVGTLLEDNARLGMFLDKSREYQRLGVGMADAARGAAMDVKKFLFDYSDAGLTDIEREVLKRAMPFYSWTRNNLPLQLESILKHPGKFAAVEKARKANVRALGGPPDERPMADWMVERYPWQVTRKGERGGADYMLMEGVWPGADIGLLRSPTDLLMNMIGGPGKTAYEVAQNYSTFLKKPIEERPGQRETLFGLPVNKRWVSYPVKQISRGASTLDWATRGELSPAGLTGRLAIGKVYPYDPGKSYSTRGYVQDRTQAAIDRDISDAYEQLAKARGPIVRAAWESEIRRLQKESQDLWNQ